MPDTNVDRAIGRLEGRMDEVARKIDALSSAVRAQADAEAEGRRRLYERVGVVETTTQIAGQIQAQTRDRIDRVDVRISEEVMQKINDVKRWKITGMTLLAVVGVAGASIGATAFWLWEVFVDKVRGWFYDWRRTCSYFVLMICRVHVR